MRNRLPRLAAICSSGLLALSLTYTLLISPAPADDDIIYPPKSSSNGKRIYLSAAWHTDQPGARGECDYPNGTARTERYMARNIGRLAADFTFIDHGPPAPHVVPSLSGLTERGFRVRLGRGDPNENTTRSNDWGANAHVPLHSNAFGSASGSCTSRTGGNRGTVQIYNQGDGSVLPTRLKTQLEGITPGGNDKICTPISACTNVNCLIELCGISAAAASYSETEFHDWDNGTKFLVNDDVNAGVKIATAIDNHYGG